MDFQLHRKRSDKISRQEIIEDLTQVAEVLDFKKFSKNDFRKYGKISIGTVVREFDSWTCAIENLNKFLEAKFQKKLILTEVPANRIYSDHDLFAEMERIWTIIEHRPSRNEWEISLLNLVLVSNEDFLSKAFATHE